MSEKPLDLSARQKSPPPWDTKTIGSTIGEAFCGVLVGFCCGLWISNQTACFYAGLLALAWGFHGSLTARMSLRIAGAATGAVIAVALAPGTSWPIGGTAFGAVAGELTE